MTEFERRRATFVKEMGEAVAVIPSAPPSVRTNDSEFEYRQDTDFYYLTGFEEPDSVLVLAPNHPTIKSAIFARPRDREKEVWEGRRAGPEQAARDVGADAGYPVTELERKLPEFLDTADRLYYAFAQNETFNQLIIAQLKRYRFARRRADRGPLSVVDPATIVHEMRVKKSAQDIKALRRAVLISQEGHVAAMRRARPGMHEYEIEAILEYVFTSRGARSSAYPSIVAGGRNATVLHYHSNRERVPDGALVLVDAGAEVDYFCGDITRTWPISGTFSPEQKAVYEIVLAANLRGIELCKPGAKLYAEINDAATNVLVAGLIDLGLLKGSVEENIEKNAYKEYFMHRFGHMLGMDTHDVGFYRKDGDWRPLEPGMVVTAEPGLYIREDSDAPDRFKGIGVRIEDDVLVTADGHEILSSGTPKTVAQVERTIAEGRETREPLLA